MVAQITINTFNNLRECGPKETQQQICYLSRTPVARIGDLLRRGQCILKKGVVGDLRNLGNLKTEFSQIGPHTSNQRNGRSKFLVSEVVPMLHENQCAADRKLLEKIDAFMETEAKNEIKFNITLLAWNGEYIIKDGNKRTIAFFENRRNLSHAEINYEVYLVICAQRNA